ncbi:MAG: alpha/beta fold hydrolase [bacterium]|nr:alpha/beta fold hydrolase [bacterium]
MKGKAGGVPTFVFFGGPGESALDFGSLEALRASHAELLDVGDVVFVEQRGVGASRPNLDCEPVHLPLDRPLQRADFMAAYERILPDCIEAAGADMRGYTTVEIADDAEAIRRALGSERINLVGGSYGAQQAYYYIRRHGDRVNRAVLSQFLTPHAALVLPSTIDDYIHQIGERVGPAYGFDVGGGERLEALMQSVYAEVDARPVEIQVGDATLVAGRTDLEILTALALRRTHESWSLPALFGQMNEGEFGSVGPAMLQFYRGGLPVNAAVLALDSAAMTDRERRAQFAAEVGESLSGHGAHLPFPDVCEHLEPGHVPETYLDIEALGDVPILFIQGELDARARDEDLSALVSNDENMRLLLIKNVTHDLGRSVSDTIDAELRAITSGFLAGGEWPAVSEIEVPVSLK